MSLSCSLTGKFTAPLLEVLHHDAYCLISILLQLVPFYHKHKDQV